MNKIINNAKDIIKLSQEIGNIRKLIEEVDTALKGNIWDYYLEVNNFKLPVKAKIVKELLNAERDRLYSILHPKVAIFEGIDIKYNK